MKRNIAIPLATALLSAALTISLRAQGTAFTYQGRLDSGGTPVNGSYDVEFTLYGTNVGAAAVAGPVTNSAVAVANGLFTTTVDFGGDIFTGANYWLEMGVRAKGGAAFTTLAPRQELLPVPYVIFAGATRDLLGTGGIASEGSTAAFGGVASGVSSADGTNTLAVGNSSATAQEAEAMAAGGSNASGTSNGIASAFGGSVAAAQGLPSGAASATAVGGSAAAAQGFGSATAVSGSAAVTTFYGVALAVSNSTAEADTYSNRSGAVAIASGNSSALGEGASDIALDNSTATANSISATNTGGPGGFDLATGGSNASGTNCVAIDGSTASGVDSLAIDDSGASAPEAIAIGSSAAVAYSFAAGNGASATNNNTFVWSDGSTNTASTTNNQFVARAGGGFVFYTSAGTGGAQLPAGSGSWTSLSDRNAKNNLAPVNPQMMLDKLVTLPVSEWSYKTEPGVRHIGPMAQDFSAGFGVGEDNKHIADVDEGGVALAAIQGFNQKLIEEIKCQDAEHAELRRKIEALKQQVNQLDQQLNGDEK